GDRAGASVGIGAGQRQHRTPATAGKTLTDRGVYAVQLELRLGEPLLQVGHRCRIAVVELCPRPEQLDPLEPMRANLEEMFGDEPVVVEQVRRNPEGALSRLWLNYALSMLELCGAGFNCLVKLRLKPAI